MEIAPRAFFITVGDGETLAYLRKIHFSDRIDEICKTKEMGTPSEGRLVRKFIRFEE